MKRKLYIPKVATVFAILAIICGIIHFVSLFSVSFSDLFNLKIAGAFRFLFAKITGIFPFSLAEILIILSPIWIALIIFFAVKLIKADVKKRVRFLATVLSVIMFIYSSFVLTFATAYRGTSLEDKLGLERTALSGEDIYVTLVKVTEELSVLKDSVEYDESGLSVMPYGFSELNKKLNEAYKSASESYGFINSFKSRVKRIMLSEPMTYTHISGVYTFFTGEANVNVNYPDFVVAYTTAHEMAHQRGIAREDEANFIAFLVCLESDDAYVRYSAYLNMYEYLLSSLCKADIGIAREFFKTVPSEVRAEMSAYSEFFEKYSENKVADVSDKINNSYLISQGQTAGVKSYGLVTELAVAYYKSVGE